MLPIFHCQIHPCLDTVDYRNAGITVVGRSITGQKGFSLVEVGQNECGEICLRSTRALGGGFRFCTGHDDRNGETFNSGAIRVLVECREICVVKVVIHEGPVDIGSSEEYLLLGIKIFESSKRTDDIVCTLDDLVEGHVRNELTGSIGIH